MHFITRCAVTTCVAVLSFCGSAHAAIFSDNFDAGASPLWSNDIGNWTATGGVYQAGSPSNNPSTITVLPYVLTDLELDLDINNVQDGGVWLRVEQFPDGRAKNGVVLVTGGYGGTGNGLYWHTFTNGGFSGILNPVSGLFSSGVSDPHLRVTVSGDTYAAYVDGSPTPATTLTTTVFASGQVGLYDFSPQTFDNVVLIPEPTTLGLVLVGGLALLRRKR